jgi:hypothetical protein
MSAILNAMLSSQGLTPSQCGDAFPIKLQVASQSKLQSEWPYVFDPENLQMSLGI